MQHSGRVRVLCCVQVCVCMLVFVSEWVNVVYMCVCACVCWCLWVSEWMLCTCVCVCVCMRACVYVGVCEWVNVVYVCVCVCVCVLNGEGSCVFASTAPAVWMAMSMTGYSDQLTSFHEPVHFCHLKVKQLQRSYWFQKCLAQSLMYATGNLPLHPPPFLLLYRWL